MGTDKMRSDAPDDAKNCFVYPMHGALTVNGLPRTWSYLPWGTPLRQQEAAPDRQNYSSPAIASVKSCDHEPLVQAMQQRGEYSWCVGCEFSTAFAMLQSMIAAKPFESAVAW